MALSLTAAALGLLFFAASDFEHGRELWVSDGSRAGTRMVEDLSPGESNTAFEGGMFPVPGGVVFIARQDETGSPNVYFSDGTKRGTRVLKDEVDRFYGSAGGVVYFGHAASGRLWMTDGTPKGTVAIGKTETPYQFGGLTLVNFKGKALFAAPPFDGSWTGSNYVSYLHDPKTNVTTKLPVTVDGNTHPRIAALRDRFIYVRDTPKYGYELWSSDGTAKGTRLLRDLIKGPLGGLDPRWSPSILGPLAFKGRAYFIANDNKKGSELWSTDGTAEGTILVRDFEAGPGSPSITFTNVTGDPAYNRLLTAGDKILVEKSLGPQKSELFTTDGTPEGTKAFSFKDEAGRTVRPSLGIGTVMGSPKAVLFEGYAGDGPSALYIGNLDKGKARLLKDINKDLDCLGRDYDFIYSFAQRGEASLFAAADKTTISGCPNRVFNSELWTTDGTRDGTVKVEEIYPGIGGSIGKEYRYIGSDPMHLTLGAPVSP